jgi:N-acetylglucosaminyl-diphospho-decaprenol L-rhamnosyltransferase
MTDLSIAIVSWNVRELLSSCLQSVAECSARSGFSVETVVVDNASSDGSRSMVAECFPGVRLIANASNVGFSAANNQAICVATGRHVLLLNPDTEIVGDALYALVTYADRHPDIGVVGPQLLDPDGGVQSSRRRFPSRTTAFFESTWLRPWAPKRLLRRYYVLDKPNNVVQDVDWVDGAALMARRAAINEVGLLDEEFFMYSEELDWCRRFNEAGWRVVYLPEAQIVHHRGKSSDQAVAARHIHFQTSKVRYFQKYHGAPFAFALRCFLLLSYAFQIGLEAVKWLVGHRRPLRTQRIRSYVEVLGSGLKSS